MFTNYGCVSILFIINAINSEFIPINWNISSEQGKNHFEREYKYPMFEEVAPVPCDLTEDFCDFSCPEDADCSVWQKSNLEDFEPDKTCGGTLSFYNCECEFYDKPVWLSFLCFVYKNPIYLGKFFQTKPKTESATAFKTSIEKNTKKLYKYDTPKEKGFDKTNPPDHYHYGSDIMTFVPKSDLASFPSVTSLKVKVPVKDTSKACVSGSVKYRINVTSICLVRITKELCANGQLSILPHLVQDSTLPFDEHTPTVLKNLNYLEGINSEVTIEYSQTNFEEKKFKNKKYLYIFQQGVPKPCDDFLGACNPFWSEGICYNTLGSVEYKFVLNGSDIIQLKAKYVLSNISIPDEPVSEKFVPDKYMYLKQIFYVNFVDVEYGKQIDNFSEVFDEFNRGYFIGEELNFGYKSTYNSTASWQRGVLAMFKNGKFNNFVEYKRFRKVLRKTFMFATV